MKTNTIYNENCLETVKRMPDGFINCVVTSPPYFGLRNYNHDEQFGLEETPELFVQNLVTLFREIRRALRDDGTVWLNLGDSYASSGVQDPGAHKGLAAFTERYDGIKRNEDKWKTMNGAKGATKKTVPLGLKPKDLFGIPWRVAFALQADGWYLRQDIIWHKPNPMPESVTDRCTKSHEYIFLLSKSQQYFYDAEAVREKSVTKNLPGQGITDTRLSHGTGGGNTGIASAMAKMKSGELTGRNKRSVWTVNTKPYKEAHFAVFPDDLIKPCILAGCPKGGIVYDPFGGSGTTAEVAIRAGRNWIISELNPEYVNIANKRLEPYLTQTTLF